MRPLKLWVWSDSEFFDRNTFNHPPTPPPPCQQILPNSIYLVFSVPVCKVAWYDDSNTFAAGFMDGVLCLASKEASDVPKMVQAHQVCAMLPLFLTYKCKLLV